MSVWTHAATGSPSLSATPNWAARTLDFPATPSDSKSPTSNPLGFAIFLLLNAILFIRPSEIIPDLAEYPIYYIVILPCIVVSLPTLLFKVVSRRNLAENPIAICVLGLFPLAIVSMIGRIALADMREPLTDYAKVLIYFLLLISCVNSAKRIRVFLTCLIVYLTILTAIAVMQWHEVIDIPNFQMCSATRADPDNPGVAVLMYRLQATGIFNDPNDFCMAVGLGAVLCLCKFGDRAWGSLRVLWLTPIPLYGHALYLTQSRGGLLGLVVGILVLLGIRFGWRKGVALAILCSPLLYLLSGTRQSDMEVGGGTAQARIHLWSEGFALMRNSPLQGIGFGQYGEQVGAVAHNSFVHTFVELGFFGGALFVGAFFLAVGSIYRLGKMPWMVPDPEMRRIRPYMLAAVAAYMGSMYSLSRCYVVPTYMILGLATVYVRAAVPSGAGLLHWDWTLVKRLLVVGFLVLAGLYMFVRIFAQFGS
jgi:hypothetical protein